MHQSDLTPQKDQLERPLNDLRISVTDRCNFRCTYCMPKEVFGHSFDFMPKSELLTFEEITRLVGIFASLGVQKIRITGGEPLIRHQIEKLVAMLAEIDGIEVAMTTNASLLRKKAKILKDAGLDRLTVSLDSLDDATFKKINDVAYPVELVLDGIKAAEEAGFDPVKVNMVAIRGVNEKEIIPMAEYFRENGGILRFIEFMDVGNTNKWQMDDVIPAKEILDTINKVYPLEPVEPNYHGEVAKRLRYKDGKGEIGMIASVTQPFCGDCTRLRISANGQLFTCLFGLAVYDLRELVRSSASDEDIVKEIHRIWGAREDRYSEIRSEETADNDRVEMSYIGG